MSEELLKYNTCGMPLTEGIIYVVEKLCFPEYDCTDGRLRPSPYGRYEGSIVVRVNERKFWVCQAEQKWAFPVIVVKGVRVMDMSQILGLATQTLHVRPDPKVSRGDVFVETPDGKLLAHIFE